MMTNKSLTLLAFCFILISFNYSCKKKGCTDTAATNYNAKAKKDDGTCVYPENLPISYPANGHYGLNVLNTTDTSFNITDEYSFKAVLPANKSIKIIMTNTSTDPNGIWFYMGGTPINLIISSYDEVEKKQIFESNENGKDIDLNMSFGGMEFVGPGSATIEIFENKVASPTRVKYITW